MGADAGPGDSARSGGFLDYEPRPPLPDDARACSFRHALCVHAVHAASALPASPKTRQAAEAQVLAWLAAADRAWDVATGALALPSPDGPLDVYLVAGDPYATRTLLDRRDASAGYDRVSAFALAGRGAVPGCALDTAAARVVAHAVLFGVAPATDEGSATAESAYMASLMSPCAGGLGGLDAGVAYFQAHPEVGLADTLAPPSESMALDVSLPVVESPGEIYGSGVALFYDWVDRSFGRYPGAIVRAMWALSPTLTPGGAARWHDDPDGFEVLRTSFKNALTTGSTVDDLWLDFAVARAFEPRFPVRKEWSIGWPSAPRSLMSGVGVAPTGAAYVSVDCANRPKGARLRFEARWEEHARFLWSLVRVDAEGHEISRVGVPAQDRGTEAQATLVDLDGTARVLVVGTNTGDPATHFDPDDYVWEPHGWIVSLAGE